MIPSVMAIPQAMSAISALRSTSSAADAVGILLVVVFGAGRLNAEHGAQACRHTGDSEVTYAGTLERGSALLAFESAPAMSWRWA